jgi:hypothetical protein
LTARLEIRPVADHDMAAIQNFHAHHVSHGLASWELTPPDVEEPTARRDGAPSGGYPYLVAMQEEQLVGMYRPGPIVSGPPICSRSRVRFIYPRSSRPRRRPVFVAKGDR